MALEWLGARAQRDGMRLATIGAPFVVLSLLFGGPASAAFDQAGSTVSCTGTTTNYNGGTQTGLDITVQSGATVIGVGTTDAIRIQNSSGITGNAITNNGTIDGFVTILSVNPGTDSFTNHGVLQVTDPAASLQQHSMAGSAFIQSASGTLNVRVDSAGFSDGIFSRTASLNGRLVAVVQAGLYTTPITYTGVIDTSAGVTGSFSSVTSSSPFFSVELVTSGNDRDLTLTAIAFNAVSGLTKNQKAVGDALQGVYGAGTPTGNAATFFSNLFAATSIGVYDQLSGEGTSAAQDASFSAGGQFNNVMMQQGLGWLTGASGGNSVTAGGALGYAAMKPGRTAGHEAFAAMQPRAPETGRWRAWGTGFGAMRSANGESGSGSADRTTRSTGGAFGIDRQVTNDLLFGVALGGSGSSFSISSLSTSGRVDGGHIGLYAVKGFGKAYLAGTLNYARFDNSTERTITGVGPTETAKGRFNSDMLGGRLELGWRYGFNRYVLTPYAAIEPTALWQDAYTESSTTSGGGNGILGLSYARRTTTSLPTFLGVQIETSYALLGGMTLTPSARLSWVHEFNPDREIEASFVTLPGSGFTVAGARAARDSVRIDTGATLAIGKKTALFAGFNGEFSGTSTMVAGNAGARVNW